MKKFNQKQRLASTDEPIPVPADTLGLDMTHAINSFQPGTHQMEDLSAVLPLVNKKSRSSRLLVHGRDKRVSSMPIVKTMQTQKAASPARIDTNQTLEHARADASKSLAPARVDTSKSLANPISFARFKDLPPISRPSSGLSGIDSVELDTIPADYSLSTIPSSSPLYRPIIEVIQSYDAMSSTSSVLTVSYVDIDLKAEVSSELSSFYEDSLFSNDSTPSHVSQRCTSAPAFISRREEEEEKPLPIPPVHTVPYEESDYVTKPLNFAPKKTTELKSPEPDKILPLAETLVSKREKPTTGKAPELIEKLPTPPQPIEIPPAPRKLPKPTQSIVMPRVRENAKFKNQNRFSTYSAFSVKTTATTLHEAKQEIKKIALLQPFKYCFDSGIDYEFSKYPTPNRKVRHSSYYGQRVKDPDHEKKTRATSLYYPPRAKTEKSRPTSMNINQSSLGMNNNHSNETILTSFVNRNKEQIMDNFKVHNDKRSVGGDRKNRFLRFFS